MDKKEIKFNIPLRLYQRINRVSESLGYNDVEEFISYYMSLNFQAFDTPEEQHYEGWRNWQTRQTLNLVLLGVRGPPPQLCRVGATLVVAGILIKC